MKAYIYVMWDEIAEQLVSRPSFFPNDETAIREFCNGAKDAPQIQDINLYRLAMQVDLDDLTTTVLDLIPNSNAATLVYAGLDVFGKSITKKEDE